MNAVSIIGRLTRDPELRYTPSGKPVCSFSLAVDRAGEKQGDEIGPGFFDVSVWEKQGENCAQYLVQGQQAAVQGRLTFRRWEAKDGTKRSAVEIVASHVTFLAKPAAREGEQMRFGDRTEFEPAVVPAAQSLDFDMDIPF